MHPYLQLMRIKSWKELSYFCLLGILVSKTFSLIPAFTIYLAVCIASSSIFVINNIYDASCDTSEEKKIKNPIVEGKIKRGHAQLFAILLFCVSLLLFSLFLTSYNLLLVIVGILLAYLYSIPPLRFKERPPTDIFFHGIIPSISFLFSYTTFAPLSSEVLLFTLAVIFLGGGMSLMHQLQDFAVDAQHNLKTSAIIYGKKKASCASSILFSGALFILLYLSASGFLTWFLIPLILSAFYVPVKIFLEREREEFAPLISYLRRFINVIFSAIVITLVADIIL